SQPHDVGAGSPIRSDSGVPSASSHPSSHGPPSARAAIRSAPLSCPPTSSCPPSRRGSSSAATCTSSPSVALSPTGIVTQPLGRKFVSAGQGTTPVFSLVQHMERAVPVKHSAGVAPRTTDEERSMRHSSERILTTHTGSLPRPKGLTELVFEKQEGKHVDPASFEAA